MSLTRVLKELLNPTRLPWEKKPRVGNPPDCRPAPPRDPPPVKPPEPECTTGPDLGNLRKILKK